MLIVCACYIFFAAIRVIKSHISPMCKFWSFDPIPSLLADRHCKHQEIYSEALMESHKMFDWCQSSSCSHTTPPWISHSTNDYNEFLESNYYAFGANAQCARGPVVDGRMAKESVVSDAEREYILLNQFRSSGKIERPSRLKTQGREKYTCLVIIKKRRLYNVY